MSSWGSFSFLYGPLLAVLALVGLAFIARWASRPGASLIESPPTPGTAEEYGLMIPVASPSSDPASQEMAARLAASGVRCRQVMTTEGRRIMVWSDDVARARSVLDSAR